MSQKFSQQPSVGAGKEPAQMNTIVAALLLLALLPATVFREGT